MRQIIEALEHTLTVIEAHPETEIINEIGGDVYEILQLTLCRLAIGEDRYQQLLEALGPGELLGQWVEKPETLTASVSA